MIEGPRRVNMTWPDAYSLVRGRLSSKNPLDLMVVASGFPGGS
jgi:hypothetical protein